MAEKPEITEIKPVEKEIEEKSVPKGVLGNPANLRFILDELASDFCEKTHKTDHYFGDLSLKFGFFSLFLGVFSHIFGEKYPFFAKFFAFFGAKSGFFAEKAAFFDEKRGILAVLVAFYLVISAANWLVSIKRNECECGAPTPFSAIFPQIRAYLASFLAVPGAESGGGCGDVAEFWRGWRGDTLLRLSSFSARHGTDYVLVAHVTRRGATRRSERRIPFASVFAGDGTACVARAEAAVAAAVAAAGGEA
eukprot:TRINITY_DN2158_c0_g1_i1.p1 TRINITY_DN2158_c0_g1~~TRINITY_DN2158_c0_g1_i1.p1  ORF type:complete len:250 (+),score=48.71 TRINITY_DN2158_c0_g1_i1:80-829(+)